MTPQTMFPKLDPDEVREIRQLFRAEAGFPTICEKFSVSRDHVMALCFHHRRDNVRHSHNEAKKKE